MNKKNIEVNQYEQLLTSSISLIDVRAPVEFLQGHIPGAINLPILIDHERSLIGTTYKKQGREVAIKLGHELISGDVKNRRIEAWLQYIEKNPNAVIYCFRGGLRSQITKQWLSEAGLNQPIIIGGYKSVRNFLIESTALLAQKNDMLIVSGSTGSRKTKLLEILKKKCPVVNLEALACHRGSAFGATDQIQPTQINFENQLACELLNLNYFLNNKKLLVEDESRLIGRIAIPLTFFEKMRSSPVIWVEEPLESRVENIFQDYILNSTRPKLDLLNQYKNSILSISKKLGGLRSQEILTLISSAEGDYKANGNLQANKLWIEKILDYYYDPIYLNNIYKRQVKVVFKGSYQECEKYLLQAQT